MKDCRNVEQLLFLHREGERTPEEESALRAHLDTCTKCAGIALWLSNMDRDLSSARSAAPFSGNDRILVDRTLTRLTGKREKAHDFTLFDRILDRTRSTLAASVAVLLCLLLIQETRDALKASSLDQRLRNYGSAAFAGASVRILPPPSALQSFLRSGHAESRISLNSPPIMASIGDEEVRTLVSALSAVFGPSDDLFMKLSKRYPNVSRINFDDGLDEWERRVLATEGQIVLRDLQQLFSEGVQ